MLRKVNLLALIAYLLVAAHGQAQGPAYSWGVNGSGQLGIGVTGGISSVPVPVSVLTSGVTAVEGGGFFSLAVRSGSLYTWGQNNYGQLGNGTTSNTSVPASVSGMSGVTSASAGMWHAAAVQNGAVYTWGLNSYGQLGNGTTANSSVPLPVASLASGVTAVSAGNLHTLAIQNGAVFAWGSGDTGQLGHGSRTMSALPVAVSGMTSGVTAVSAGGWDLGEAHSLAIRNGALYAWGSNVGGQLGNGSNFDSLTPIAVPGMTSGVTAISAGAYHSLAVLNGEVFAWGDNGNGQIGDGTRGGERTQPILVTGGGLPDDFVSVAATRINSYALTSSGRLFAWGWNGSGELGQGDLTSRYTPTEVFAPQGYLWSGISAGSNHAMAFLTPVPEPSTYLLIGAVGATCLAISRFKRARVKYGQPAKANAQKPSRSGS